MSAIRPQLPAVQVQTQPAGQAAVNAARAAFFKAALDGVQATGAESTARSAAPQSTAKTVEDRPMRPGTLLDIRV